MLTKRQRDCLIFIADFQKREGGVSPSMAEIADGMGLSCRAKAHYHLTSLEERGFIQRIHNRARAIEILKPVPGGKEPPKRTTRIPIFDADTLQLNGYLPQ